MRTGVYERSRSHNFSFAGRVDFQLIHNRYEHDENYFFVGNADKAYARQANLELVSERRES